MSWMTLLGALGPIACAEPLPDPEETSPDDEEEDAAEDASAIVDGQPNDGSAPTVGVYSLDGQPVCTATQVSCNAVLTAAHCVRYLTQEDEDIVRELDMAFTLTDQATTVKVIGFKSFGRPSGPDDIALLRIEHGCGPEMMYPPLAAALPGAGAQLTTWGESCDQPLRAAILPWERQLVEQFGTPLPGATSAKRYRKSAYDPAWPQDSTEGASWTVYPGRRPGHRYGKTVPCKGDSGGPTFAGGEIAFVSSYLLLMGRVFYPENGNPPSLTYFVDGMGFAEIPKWRAQLMDKIAEWSHHCGSADSGTSSGSDSGSSGSSGGSGGSGSSICLTSYASPASGPFSDDMPLSASGTWVGDNWLSFDGPGSNDTFTELCVLDGSGTLGVGSECQSAGSDSGSGDGYSYGDSSSGGAGGSGSGYGYGDSSSGGAGGSGSGYGYGDSGSGGAGGSGSGYGYGDSGSGYSSGDSSYSDSGYGYCVDSGQGGGCSDSGSGDGQGDSSYSDSGSYGGGDSGYGGGYGDSGSGGGYGDSGSGGGYGDSGSGGAGGEAGDGGDGGGGGGT